MFSGKNDHGPVKNHYIVNTTLFSAFTLIVNDRCTRKIVILIPRLQDTVGKINILAIHKKTLIEETYFVEYRFSEEHKGSGKYINPVGLIIVEKAQMISPESP